VSAECTCQNPILRWVHNAPPTPCGGFKTREAITDEVRESLRKAMIGFIGSKVGPETIDSMRGQLLAFCKANFNIDAADQFDVVASGDHDFNIIPKTEWARELLMEAQFKPSYPPESLRLDKEVHGAVFAETIEIPSPEEKIVSQRVELAKALQYCLATDARDFGEMRNTPYTRFKIAQKIGPMISTFLKIDASRHFTVVCNAGGVDLIPKTDWARALMASPAPR
jgi:hypothetical protein